jgi:very-short-patch-repair endonuclease
MKGHLTSAAKGLRKRPTEAEKALWHRLRYRQLQGFKFRRQQPIGPYIVDFVNFESKLIIELDGSQHAIETEGDRKRDKRLKDQGFQVLRFWNNEVFENIDGVLDVLRDRLLSPSLGPSHKGREERTGRVQRNSRKGRL